MDSTTTAPTCRTRACGWQAKTGPDSVIIDPAHFMPGKVFQINGPNERKHIALGNPLERSEGWIRVVAEPVKS